MVSKGLSAADSECGVQLFMEDSVPGRWDRTCGAGVVVPLFHETKNSLVTGRIAAEEVKTIVRPSMLRPSRPLEQFQSTTGATPIHE